MTPDLRCLVYSVLLTWVMVMTGSLVRSSAWTPAGLGLALGNRDNLPEASPVSARADRAARNMLENLLMFAVLLLGAHAAGVPASRLDFGATLFLGSRVLYFPLYVAGVRYLRTLAWAGGVAGMALILLAML